MNTKNSNPAESWTPELEQLLSSWHRRVGACQHAYYKEAERYKRYHFWLGVPAVILSSVVGTAVFATLASKEIDTSKRVAVALVSISAAVLAGLQTFLRLAESASSHAVAAGWYAAIKRDIEQLQAHRPEERGHAKESINTVRKEMNKAGQKSPELRESVWLEAAKRYGVEEGRAADRPARHEERASR